MNFITIGGILLCSIFITALSLYWLPYLIKKGWEDGRNASVKTVKICDMCFRDIEKWNEWNKKLEKPNPKVKTKIK